MYICYSATDCNGWTHIHIHRRVKSRGTVCHNRRPIRNQWCWPLQTWHNRSPKSPDSCTNRRIQRTVPERNRLRKSGEGKRGEGERRSVKKCSTQTIRRHSSGTCCCGHRAHHIKVHLKTEGTCSRRCTIHNLQSISEFRLYISNQAQWCQLGIPIRKVQQSHSTCTRGESILQRRKGDFLIFSGWVWKWPKQVMHETNISGTPTKEQKTMPKIRKLTQIPIKYRQLTLRVSINYLKINY